MPPVKVVDPRKKILEKILNTPQARPPVKNEYDQRRVDAIRNRAEEGVEAQRPEFRRDDYESEAGKLLERFRDSASVVGRGGEAGDDGCVPFKDYGAIVGGEHTGAIAKYCSPEDLKGGEDASSYQPPGWPKSNYRDPDLKRQYGYNRCHLIPRQGAVLRFPKIW